MFLAPTKPLVHQQMDACQQFMGSAKVRKSMRSKTILEPNPRHYTFLKGHLLKQSCLFKLAVCFWPGPAGMTTASTEIGGLVQVNSIVLDGSVSKDERVNHWTSEHRRIIFATPQAFKNDVFKGNTTRHTSSGGCGKQTFLPPKPLETPLAWITASQSKKPCTSKFCWCV